MDRYEGLMTDFGFAGMTYLILAMLLQTGFPPLYKPWKIRPDSDAFEIDIKENLPIIFGLFGMFLAYILTEVRVFMAGAGLVAIWGGLRVRRALFSETGGPLPWVENYWTLKWPMLVFDLWTVALAVAVGFL